jgi:hypothetical protein
MFVRPKLSDFTIHSPKDLTVCRMGLFATMVKLLGKMTKSAASPIRCKSPYFFPQIFYALRSFARDFSIIGQNQLSPDEYEARLFERIENLERLVISEPVEEEMDEDEDATTKEDEAGMSILEDIEEVIGIVEDGEATADKEAPRCKSAGFWPLFRTGNDGSGGTNANVTATAIVGNAAGGLSSADEWTKQWRPLTSTPVKKQKTEEISFEPDLTAIEEVQECSRERDENDLDVSLLSDLPELSIEPSLANIAWQDIEASTI